MAMPSIAKARERVRRFASSPQSTDEWPYFRVEGFIFALAAAPDLVRPSEWLAFMGVDEAWSLSDTDTGLHAYEGLLSMYNHALAAGADGRAKASCTARFRKPAMANFEADAPIRLWSEGMVRGMSWLEETWKDALDSADMEEASCTFGQAALTLAFFADIEIARLSTEAIEDATLEQLAEELAGDHALAMRLLAELGHALYQVSLEEMHDDVPMPFRNAPLADDDSAPAGTGQILTFPKPGRNAPCPCGSGLKYKRCCGKP